MHKISHNYTYPDVRIRMSVLHHFHPWVNSLSNINDAVVDNFIQFLHGFIMQFIFSAVAALFGTRHTSAHQFSPVSLSVSAHRMRYSEILPTQRTQLFQHSAMLRHAAPLVVTKGGSVSESLRQIWHWQHDSNTRASF